MKKLVLLTMLTLAAAAGAAAADVTPSVTLDTERSTITFGGSLTLSGSVAPVMQGQKVTITQTRQDRSPRSVQVAPDTNGDYSLDVAPRMQTQVQAKYATGESQPQVIFVRPRIGLRKYGRTRFAVSVVAARSFVGKYVWIARWNRRAHTWSNVKRVFLTRYVRDTGASTAAFRLRVRGRHVKLRAFLNTSQARPGYVFGYSNFIVT